MKASTIGELKKNGKPDNKCSDCLFLDIDIVSKSKKKADLLVTAFFNYECVQVIGGELIFGLKGGDLRILGEGVELKEHIVLSDFSWKVDKQTRTAVKMGKKEASSVSAGAKVTGSGPGGSANLSSSSEASEEAGQEDQASYQVWQATALNGENPGWRFLIKTGEHYLDGNISKQSFGRLKGDENVCSLLVRFTTEQRHVYVDVTAGALWNRGDRDIRRFKVANLYLWHQVIKPLVAPYVSQVQFVSN